MEQVAQKHEDADGFVGCAPLQEYLWLKLVEYLVEYLLGDVEGWSAEEYPACCYEMEGEEAAEDDNGVGVPGAWCGWFALAGQIADGAEDGADGLPYLVDTEEEPVQSAPEDEVEGGSVPKSAKEHRHEQIEVLAKFAVAVASKADVEVVFEP